METIAAQFNTFPCYIFLHDGKYYSFENVLRTEEKFIDPFYLYHDVNASAEKPLPALTPEMIINPFILFNAAFIKTMNTFGEYALGGLEPRVREMLILGWNTFYYKDDASQLYYLKEIGHEWIADFEKRKREFVTGATAAADKTEELSVAADEDIEDIFDVDEPEELELVYTPIELTRAEYVFKESYNFPNLYPLMDRLKLSAEGILAIFTKRFYKVLEQTYTGAINIPEEETKMNVETITGQITVEHNIDESLISLACTDAVTMKLFPQIVGTFDAAGVEILRDYSFSIHNVRIDALYLEDMVMNIPVFTKQWIIDESTLYYSNSRQLMELIHRATGVKFTLYVSSDYIKARFQRFTNVAEAEFFRDELTTLITLYNTYAKYVTNIYNKFFLANNMADEVRGVSISSRAGQYTPITKILPEVYKPGFTRFCAHLPELITPEEKNQDEQDGYKTLSLKSKEGKDYHFSCRKWANAAKDNNFIYPNWRKNSLANNDLYPVLPCCYLTDHDLRSDIKREDYKVRVFKTNKFALDNQFGTLPAALELFFKEMGADITKILRRGVRRGTLSLLECILVSLDLLPKGNLAEKDGLVLEARRRFAREAEYQSSYWNYNEEKAEKEVYINVAHQELWDKSSSYVQQWLADIETFMNPAEWFSLLEYIYDVHLILMDINGFVYPRHKRGYLRRPRKVRHIIPIYINGGSESNAAAFPQCELIENLTAEELERLLQVYASSLVNYYGNTFWTGNYTFTPEMEKLAAQYIDLYGKCVQLLTTSGQVLVLDEPIAPLPLVIAGGLHEEIYESRISEFRRARTYAQTIVSNAIHLTSIGQQDKITYGKPPVEFPGVFLSSLKLPNKEVKQKVEYAVRLFAQQKPEIYANYAQLYPLAKDYETVGQFNAQEGVFVGNSTAVKDIASSFYIFLNNKSYYAAEIKNFQSSEFTLYIPALKQVVRVGGGSNTFQYIYREGHFYKLFHIK